MCVLVLGFCVFLSGDLRENPLTPLGSRGQKHGFGMFLVLRLGVVCASLLARLLACFCRCFASGSVGLVGSTGFYAYVFLGRLPCLFVCRLFVLLLLCLFGWLFVYLYVG